MNGTRAVKEFDSAWVVGQVIDSMKTMERRLDQKMDKTHEEMKAEVQSYRQEVITQGKIIATLAQRCKDQETTCGNVHGRLSELEERQGTVEKKIDGLTLAWRKVAGFLAGLVTFMVGVIEAVRWWSEVKHP